jgi:hypothetical protein
MGLVRSTSSFWVTPTHLVNIGDVYADDDPVAARRPALFEPVEAATANPGERRLIPPPSPAEAGADGAEGSSVGGDPLVRLTRKELVAYAKEHDIELTSADRKLKVEELRALIALKSAKVFVDGDEVAVHVEQLDGAPGPAVNAETGEVTEPGDPLPPVPDQADPGPDNGEPPTPES